MGENPIQVAGIIQYLFPTDGGQIQAEKITFEKGDPSIYVFPNIPLKSILKQNVLPFQRNAL